MPMEPEVASFGTVTFTVELLTLATVASCAAPTQAVLIPERLLPVMVTTVPVGPDSGLTEENMMEAPYALEMDPATAIEPASSDERQRICDALVRFPIIPRKKPTLNTQGGVRTGLRSTGKSHELGDQPYP